MLLENLVIGLYFPSLFLSLSQNISLKITLFKKKFKNVKLHIKIEKIV